MEKSIKLLLVEDSPEEADILKIYLAKAHGSFQVEWMPDLKSGLDSVARSLPDVILLDLNLADSRGLVTLDKMHAKVPQVPIVVLTAMDDEALAISSLRHGAQDYIVKTPQDQASVVRSLRYAMERHRLETRLRQAQKTQAVGRLAAGIAHDFNNVLTVILGYADMLLSRVETMGARMDVEEIKKAGSRAALLTKQLMTLSGKQVLQPESIPINEFLADMTSEMSRWLGPDIELSTDFSAGKGHVRMDPAQVREIATHLLANGRDAMPHGGRFTIQTSDLEVSSAEPSDLGIQPGKYVLLTFKDTGVGMDAQARAHLFEPFFTTKEKGEGMGLGLATVYGIVQQSGGHIAVTSAPGAGTILRLYLPKVESVEIAPTPAAGPGLKRNGSPPGVLLVDDEAVIRMFVSRVLANNGYEVWEAANGQEALRLAAGKGAIHLLLTDMLMPGMSGRELAKKMLAAHPYIKVLYMSGYTNDIMVSQGRLDPGMDFLQKPFSMDQLLAQVEKTLRGAPRAEH